MKTLLIGLVLLGLTSLTKTQAQSNEQIGAVALEDVVISADNIEVLPVNLSYIHSVVDEDTPTRVRDLEGHAARFDIKETEEFDSRYEAYEVIFKERNGGTGRIVATYDSDGKILRSYEKFTDLLLPPTVRNAVFKAHPGWTLQKDAYLVSYFHNRDVKKVYKVQITKGDEKKNLKLDIDGNMM
ncbi:hypothetical protein [Mangrovimonas aestuarii]|uniref:hypothetical protein n=1 Tax=Mangrovimonas aestuarii TaxID=3018443 RepID=UPI002378A64D|nr:hypothetical protein [Mangrovimonas aestuarii]